MWATFRHKKELGQTLDTILLLESPCPYVCDPVSVGISGICLVFFIMNFVLGWSYLSEIQCSAS